MPMQHVEPGTEEYLRDVANAILKARKVVVVTGAGISTNSGIPDFRSENGLYSLIQAQFDAASRQARQDEQTNDDEEQEALDNARPTKRRRTSVDAANKPDSITVETRLDYCQVALQDNPSLPQCTNGLELVEESAVTTATARQVVVEARFRTPQSKVATHSVLDPNTSPLSSPLTEFMMSPYAFRSHTHRRLTDAAAPLTSSPLSSPPPILFDPFEPSSPSDASSGRRSSTSLSEVDETDTAPNSLASPQNSAVGRSALPNMKGKDLFDANIWSDPIRTSVFYTFATSLRQKVRDAEPTTSHRFISHLRDRGKLVRCYTQNIDQIEEKVGLSTRLQDGPGSRGRFSRRSTANITQLTKMAEEAKSASCDKPLSENSSQSDAPAEQSQQSQPSPSDESTTSATGRESPLANEAKVTPKAAQGELPRSGVECVFLHGSLDLLRCFLCGKVCSWDDGNRESETLSGQQPECPHCVGATVAREEKGKRALGVGKLRPDIVLYGEEHPNSHLISPIITHDLGLYPDMLLILGTSLRVHGLKVMVREFAKAVHCKGGKVVFVNFTRPPDSIWGDIIDYWVQWDCDAWVTDLQVRIPKLWQELEAPKPRKKRESSGASEDSAREEKKKPPPANPVALRDTKVTGAYWTAKILGELHRITGNLELETAPARRASADAGIMDVGNIAAEVLPNAPAAVVQKGIKDGQKRSRKSAPGALEKSQRQPSTLNPNHGRSRKKVQTTGSSQAPCHGPQPTTPQQARVPTTPMETCSLGSILSSVKENARIRKRKKVDGEEIPAPTIGRRRGGSLVHKGKKDDLKLPPLQKLATSQPSSLYGKPQPMEPKSPPSGPLTSLSPNLRSAKAFQKQNAFFIDNLLVGLQNAPHGYPFQNYSKNVPLVQMETKEDANAAFALAGLRASPVMAKSMSRKQIQTSLDGRLENWGSTWSCSQ